MRRPYRHISRWAGFAAIAACGALLAACQAVVKVEVQDAPSAAPATRLVVGVTHTEFTVGSVTAQQPHQTELDVLGLVPVQNQHLMGWGVGNPQPSPGVYDWRSLDQRMALIRSTGAEPVLTLCCAPDWMKGQPAGTTDWNLLTVAPLPSHVADFARLSAAAAVRYPQVKRFQVWNEMKGFYDSANNNWDAVAYTQLYNAVYDAVKAVRPDAQVGGPYAPLDLWSSAETMSHPSSVRGPWGVVDQRPLDLLTYWLANKHGADFVSLDGWSRTRDAQFVTDPYTATDVFTVMTDWLRARTDLPIWWSEFHVSDPGWSLAKQDAVTSMAIAKMAASGASLALLWEPQATGAACTSCLWTDPAEGPVIATPLSRTMAAWGRCAPPGTAWRDARSLDPTKVYVAATEKGAFVVNKTRGGLSVTVRDQTIGLPGDGVGVFASDPACSR